jgi:lipid-binding SYLF domain-containing protein
MFSGNAGLTHLSNPPLEGPHFQRRANISNYLRISISTAARYMPRFGWTRLRCLFLASRRHILLLSQGTIVTQCRMTIRRVDNSSSHTFLAGTLSRFWPEEVHFYGHLSMRPIGMRRAFNRPERTIFMRKAQHLLFLTLAGVLTAVAADDSTARLAKATAVLNTMTQSGNGIGAGQLAAADCVVVIPGFKKGAVVVGVGHGRGFISCRTGDTWSAPGAITLDSGSLGVQLGAEEMNIVILSMDKNMRSKLLSERFAIGSDASAAWGNGTSAHGDPSAKILFYGRTKGALLASIWMARA